MPSTVARTNSSRRSTSDQRPARERSNADPREDPPYAPRVPAIRTRQPVRLDEGFVEPVQVV